MGYESVYEKDLYLKFENGKLVEEKVVDNRKEEPTEVDKDKK